MSIIEEFYYGNIEPQALTTELTPKLKKKLDVLCKKEEEMNFQVWVIPIALYPVSGSVQNLHMICL